MQRILLKTFAIAFLMNLAAYGQSLGDVARENREKQNVEDASGERPKVFTNKDLPQDTEGNQGPREAQPAARMAVRKAVEDRYTEQHLAERDLAKQRVAEQTTRQILAQENKMANLQARIDQLNESIRSACGTAQYERPCNRYSARQLQHVAQMQMQLDEQKRRLDEMQEEARHAGMHTASYDP